METILLKEIPIILYLSLGNISCNPGEMWWDNYNITT